MTVCNLITDFGPSHYVGAMKAVLLQHCPGMQIVDTTHQIGQQNVREASFILDQVFDYFPANTVHIIVVDPGVGSNREIVQVAVGEQFCICPNNGILTHLLERVACHKVSTVNYSANAVSRTFHGRDVMAPAAAKLINNKFAFVDNQQPELLRKFSIPELQHQPHKLTGMIQFIDSYGNAITNIKAGDLPENTDNIYCNDQVFPLASTYSSVPNLSSLALIGSSGLLELALRNGSAAQTFDLRVDEQVHVHF